MRRWLTALVLSAAPAAALGAPPTHVEIMYQVLYGGGPLAEVRQVLEHDGKTYHLEETWVGLGPLALLGEVHRSSRGRITDAGLQPVDYEDRRPRRPPASVHFDWDKGTMVMTFRDGPHTEPIPPHAQDRLSFLFVPAFHALAGTQLDFNVVDGKGVSKYVLDIAGRERLTVPAGEFDALRLDQHMDKADGRSTQMWMDAGHSYLPLRVLSIQKDGTRVDQVATKFRVTP
ncbi:MAG: DUF3108 domain-containing protein [Burkholderiales bacterium]